MLIMNDHIEKEEQIINPYLAGLCLGLVLLVSFLVLGAGLGASAGLARMGAYVELTLFQTHTLASEYFGKWGESPLDYYLVYMLLGTFFGALLAVTLYGRFKLTLERGDDAPARLRMTLAFVGGILVGFASRLAGGCTSGQALTGAAQLMTGSFLFMVCLFLGGYTAAFLVRRQWDD